MTNESQLKMNFTGFIDRYPENQLEFFSLNDFCVHQRLINCEFEYLYEVKYHEIYINIQQVYSSSSLLC